MNNLNSVLIEGNLVKDPEFTLTKNGNSCCTFTIATNRNYKKDNERIDEVSYFKIETWGKIANNCSEFLRKGRGVRIVGRMKQDRWLTNDNVHKESIKVVAEHIEFKPNITKEEGNDDLDS